MAVVLERSKSIFAPMLVLYLAIVALCAAGVNGRKFTIEEATIEDIQRAFCANELTSRELVDFYIDRIQKLNPVLRAVVEVNPDARDQADEADRRRRENNHGCRIFGALHGVPVLLKDTLATKDRLNTTAGSYALVGSVVRRDSHVVARLRQAGAVILGKASLSEWYSIRTRKIPRGWCARTGQGLNPYIASGSPCGSSSGSAISVASNMVAVSLGTETHGSIICPGDHNSVVGLKPTVGLTSRSGVIPMVPRFDTIGPLARTVADAVYVLDSIVGFDPRDEATKEAAEFIPDGGYKQFLRLDGLNGKRIGVLRYTLLDSNSSTSLSAFESHLNTLRERGATLLDDLQIPNIGIILNQSKSGQLTLFMTEFKISINEYLKDLIASPVRSLAEIITFNKKNAALEKLREYGQDAFIASEETNGFGEKERRAVENIRRLSEEGLEKIVQENSLDAVVTPGIGCIPILAIGGYPGITVPAGYEDDGMPFGICFGGLKGAEPKLIEIAYAFEQTTMIRRPPMSR